MVTGCIMPHIMASHECDLVALGLTVSSHGLPFVRAQRQEDPILGLFSTTWFDSSVQSGL